MALFYAKKLYRRQVVLVTHLLLIALLTTGCSGGATPSAAQPTPEAGKPPTPTSTLLPTLAPTPTETVVRGVVSIWHSWEEDRVPALVQIIATFQQTYPNVQFDVLYVPSEDLQARFETEVREGGGPTLLLGPAEWGPPLFDAGLTADLSDTFHEDIWGALNEPAVEGARYQDSLVGIPYAIQGVVLYRNIDIITLNPATFDELVTLAQASTQGEVIGAILERSFFYSGAHLQGIGGQLMDTNYQPTFNDPFGLAWVKLLKRFEEAGPPNFFSDDDLLRFKEGTVGWIIDGTWNMRSLAEALGPEKLAIDPWPTYEDGHLSGYVMAQNIYLNAGTTGDDLLATEKFIEHLISPSSQAYLGEAGFIPAAKAVQLKDPSYGPLIEQAITALADGAAYPAIPVMTYYNLNMDIALRSVFEEGAEPAEALQSAAQAIMEAIQQGEATQTP
jgi:arabinogalactan oligomer/maltooligosaccharide transport system substrate-binding protein